MAKATTATAWKPDNPGKSTSIGRGRVKLSSMNKSKKRSYKKYRGQG
jgi:hypothetical protein